MNQTNCLTRIGIGYDVHKLVPNRDLILGGVIIESDLGALGFSDADVLIHSIADSLLGAAALGDIGQHFPDNCIENKNLAGRVLLKNVVDLINAAGFDIVNIDSTVILQSPKISSYIPEIRNNLSKILNLDISRVSVKATTTEKLGFVGKNQGIAAEAISLLVLKN